MCLGTPEIAPAPPPQAPQASPRIEAAEPVVTTEVNSAGQKVRRTGVGSLRIDKASAGNGLNIPM